MPETSIQPPPLKPDYQSRPMPRRIKRSFRWRVGQLFRSWARDTFSREQLIASFKSLLWVAPMTLLIWVYAEREQMTTEHLEFRVQLRNNDPSRAVDILNAPEGSAGSEVVMTADVNGAHAKMEAIKEKLRNQDLVIDVPTLEPGRNVIEMTSLGNDPVFVSTGMSVNSLVPNRLGLNIIPLTQRRVPVSIRPTVTNLEGPPTFSPDSVTVTGPTADLSQAASEGKLAVYADLPELRESGRRTLTNVPLSPSISAQHVTLNPKVASADINVKRSEVEETLQAVPVWALYPPKDLGKFKAKYESPLNDVKVVGPPQVIERMKEPDYDGKPKAIFDTTTAAPHITDADDPKQEYEAPLHFDFGNSGVHLASDDAHKTIKFTIERPQ